MAEPLPLCYLNGAVLPLAEARISPLDRGFLYADGVYEVMPVYGGRPFRFGAHAERLTRSLAALRMDDPHRREEWRAILGTLIERNGGGDCYLYCMLALGHIDIVAEAKLKPFDIVPLIPIVEKAGGVVTHWGSEDGSANGRYIACGDPSLLEAALSALTK